MRIYYCNHCKDQYAEGQVISSESGMVCPSCFKIVKEVDDDKFKLLSEKYYCTYCDDIYSYGQLIPNGKGLMCPFCMKVAMKITNEEISVSILNNASIFSQI